MTQNLDKNQKVLLKNNQEENNVVRTSLMQALLLLLKEKKLESISITELAKNAGVSRNAYYRNYKSKDDLLNSYLDELIEKFSKTLNNYDPVSETKESWDAILSMIKDYHIQYQILLYAGYENLILERAEKILDKKEPGKIYMNHFWLGGVFSVINLWCRTDFKASKSDLIVLGSKMMSKGIKSWEI